MSKASGFVLILAGLAAAAYVLPSGGEMGEPDFGQFTDIAKSAPADVASQVVVAPEPRPAVRPAPAAAQAVPSFSTPVVVTIAQRPSELSAAPAQKAAAMPGIETASGASCKRSSSASAVMTASSMAHGRLRRVRP